jgi:hypothetical protein
LRGGSFNYVEIGLHNSNIDPGLPTERYFVYGGRIARANPGADRSGCLLESLPGVKKSLVAVVSRLEHKGIPLIRGFVAVGAVVAAVAIWILARGRRQKRMVRG